MTIARFCIFAGMIGFAGACSSGGAENPAPSPIETKPIETKVVVSKEEIATFSTGAFLFPGSTTSNGDTSDFDIGVIVPGSGGILIVRNIFNNDANIVEPDGFRAYITQSNLTDNGGRAVRGLTPSEAGKAIAVTYAEPRTDALSYFLDRETDTLIPVTGFAEYEGGYMGLYRFASDNSPAGHITGRVELSVDFTDNAVSGMITDRANTGVETLAPIILQAGTLGDGSFSGTTTGGAFDSTVAMPGTFTGMVVGENGQEVIGGVQLTHAVGGVDRFDEVGVFVGVAE